jgi:hypothetical protein
MGLADIMSFVVSYLVPFGRERPIAAMVHPYSLRSWPAGGWMRRLGAIPSTYEAAEATLRSGTPVIVFPGGDHEAGRPIWEANQVQFAGRKGFLKIARDTGVRIVPMGIRGSHFTAPILWRSDWLLPRLLVLPRLLGIKRYPLTVLGVAGVLALASFGPILSWWGTLFLAWLWLILPLNQVPWIPWSVRITIGQPLLPNELFEGDGEVLDTAYARVEGAVQAIVSAERTPSPQT